MKIGSEYIQRVGDREKEKSFKLVGTQIDEKLKWNEHIKYITKKVNYANYGLSNISKELNSENKKLLYSGLIHSHLVYSLPMWGFAKKGRLNVLLVKQKKGIRKIFNLLFRRLYIKTTRTHRTHNHMLHAIRYNGISNTN